MNDAINVILTAILAIVVAVMSVIAGIDGAISDSMARLGFGAGPQAVILLSMTIVLMVLGVRLVGGLLAWLILILLTLVAVHHMIPAAGWAAPQDWLRTI